MSEIKRKDSDVVDNTGDENYSTETFSNQLEKGDAEQNTQIKDDDDDVVDHGYAYVIILCCFLLNFGTWGMNSGFAIYFADYIEQDTFKGASKMDYSYIGGMAIGIGMVCSPIVNFISYKFGERVTIIIGNCLQFTSLMLASWSRKLWQLYLTQGLMQSFGLTFVSLPSLYILPHWFRKKRTFAGGLATAGSGAGGIVFNLGMQAVVSNRSVFWALRCQSIISFGIVWIAIILLRLKPRKSDSKFRFFDLSCLALGGFWMIAFYLITCMFGYCIILYTLSNFTMSLGYSARQGSIVSAMVQVGSISGRPSVGFISDKFGPLTVVFFCYSIVALFCFAMWIPARNYATAIAFALIEGATMGTVYGTLSPIITRLVGIAKMNVAFCMLWVFAGAAATFSPAIGTKLTSGAGNVVDPDSYRGCAIFSGCSFAACALSILMLRGYIRARDSLRDDNEDNDKVTLDNVSISPLDVLKNCLNFSGKSV